MSCDGQQSNDDTQEPHERPLDHKRDIRDAVNGRSVDLPAPRKTRKTK